MLNPVEQILYPGLSIDKCNIIQDKEETEETMF